MRLLPALQLRPGAAPDLEGLPGVRVQPERRGAVVVRRAGPAQLHQDLLLFAVETQSEKSGKVVR